MDPADQGHAEELSERALSQQPDGLEGVPPDEGWLGVVLGLLEELLDGGHLAPLFGDLESVSEHDDPASDPDWPEHGQGQVDPEGGEQLEVEGFGVEEPEQAAVGAALEPGAANEAGDPEQLCPRGEAEQGDQHPEEGSASAAGAP